MQYYFLKVVEMRIWCFKDEGESNREGLKNEEDGILRWRGWEEEDAVLYSAAPPARAIRPYGAGPSSLLIIDWEKNPAHPCPLASSADLEGNIIFPF